MLRLILPLVLGLVGTGGGVAAALYLAPGEDHDEAGETSEPATGEAAPCGPAESLQSTVAAPHAGSSAATSEFVKLANQFVVPIVQGGRVESLVVLSLTVEVAPEQTEAVHAREPRLRTAFLQAMFTHANSGGFAGNFTTSRNLEVLHEVLTAEARRLVGPVVVDVLITDIARQDAAG